MTGITLGKGIDAKNVDIDQKINVFNPGSGSMGLNHDNMFSSEDRAFFNSINSNK